MIVVAPLPANWRWLVGAQIRSRSASKVDATESEDGKRDGRHVGRQADNDGVVAASSAPAGDVARVAHAGRGLSVHFAGAKLHLGVDWADSRAARAHVFRLGVALSDGAVASSGALAIRE